MILNRTQNRRRCFCNNWVQSTALIDMSSFDVSRRTLSKLTDCAHAFSATSFASRRGCWSEEFIKKGGASKVCNNAVVDFARWKLFMVDAHCRGGCTVQVCTMTYDTQLLNLERVGFAERRARMWFICGFQCILFYRNLAKQVAEISVALSQPLFP